MSQGHLRHNEVISASLQSLIALQTPDCWKLQVHGQMRNLMWILLVSEGQCGCASVGIKDQNKH